VNVYRLSLDDGSVRVLHANSLRNYVSRVQSVGVIFDDESEFGAVIPYPNVNESNNSDFLSQIDLSHLNPTQRDELCQVLLKYEAVFSDKPGLCSIVQHEINLVPDFKPKAHAPYRIPEKLRVEVDRQIDQLLSDGKIRESCSPYAHPIVCVAKKGTDAIRICTDLRYLNKGTINDAYPMTVADDLLIKLSGAKFLSTCDCTAGYFQIPLREEDKHKTAFITHRGLFEWNVMPFGVKTASNTFQRMINSILHPHSDYAAAYIDDSAVYSNTWEEHLCHLEKVLKAFLTAGLTLKLSKCVFAKPQINFIGHVVGSGTRQVQECKVAAIMNIPECTTKTLLRSFLGMCNFYRSYISNYSDIALPLTELTKASYSKAVKFNDVQRNAFQTLKAKLCESTTLYAPVSTRPYIIRCDASDYAIGSSLSQLDENGRERPIAFSSNKLNDVQKRWATIERESYACVTALAKYDYLVYGRDITLHSDHNPLHYLTSSVAKSSKLIRWSLSLARYNLTIVHIKGIDNVTSDCLSRCI